MRLGNRPLIGVLLDEDTSTTGRFYQTNKGYFRAIHAAGGAPIGLPYHETSIEFAKAHCAGLLSTGARIKFDDDFYIEGEHSVSPFSERFAIESELIRLFLDLDRPFFGICNGMQLLGALNGGKMTYQIMHHKGGTIEHDNKEIRHSVRIEPNTKLHKTLGADEIITNSHHKEGLLTLGANTIASAFAQDGTIEAIELTDKTFAIGVQWHPEILWPTPEKADDLKYGEFSQKLFNAFVEITRQKS